MEVEEAAERATVHVEAVLRANSNANPVDLKKRVAAFINSQYSILQDAQVDVKSDAFLNQHLDSLSITDVAISKQATAGLVEAWKAELNVHVFQLNDEGPSDETDGDLTSCQIWMLPAKEVHGMWENLVYDHEIKSHLLDYAQSAMYFADRNVDSNVISWNRVVLLHGPPGTGKTSLCKALAHKLSIRMSNRYRFGQLVEVNAHSLFSKWFSESGKLVNKLFDTIRDLVDEEDVFVCVLIDEVESLTSARKSALNGNEPSDAIRVVNALLTQIDQLKERKNVMIMTTSNITEAIDLAFVDRADIKQYIGLPSARARYQILRSCIQELMRCGIIFPAQETLEAHALPADSTNFDQHTLALYKCSELAAGLSGRGLRKLPFLAHAMFIDSPAISYEKYCSALMKAIQFELKARADQAT